MSHVPGYVYLLFAVLLWMGLTRCFPRTIRVERLIVMPTVMAVLGTRSFFGLFPTLQLVDLAAGLLGLAFGVTLGMWHARRWVIQVDRQTGSVSLPGDAAMFGIIMASFAFEFMLHLGVRSGALWASNAVTAVISAILWGFFIGMPLGRSLDVVRRYLGTRPNLKAT